MTLWGGLDAKASTTVRDSLNVDGPVYLGRSLAVTGPIGATGGITGNVTGNADTATTAGTAGGLTGTPSISIENLTSSGSLTVQDAEAATIFNVAADSGDTSISGLLDVTGTTSLDGKVVLQDDLMFGTRSIQTSTTAGTINDMLEIVLPTDQDFFIGIVDVTFIGDIYFLNTREVGDNNDTEIITASYAISRFDSTLTATITLIDTNYYNKNGAMATPSSNTKYATMLQCETGSTWTPNADTIRLRYKSPDLANWYSGYVTVLYEIRSGGVPYPAGLQGLWAR